jgi:hypothetical protein
VDVAKAGRGLNRFPLSSAVSLRARFKQEVVLEKAETMQV